MVYVETGVADTENERAASAPLAGAFPRNLQKDAVHAQSKQNKGTRVIFSGNLQREALRMRAEADPR
jgi:hypothetical protein